MTYIEFTQKKINIFPIQLLFKGKKRQKLTSNQFELIHKSYL